MSLQVTGCDHVTPAPVRANTRELGVVKLIEVRQRSAKVTGTVAVTMTALSCVGMASLLLMTRWGIGTSPDSAQYLRGARDLLEGAGALLGPSGEAASLVQHAPLYSLLLAAGGLIGLDPENGARWQNTLVFGLNILLVGFMVQRSTRNVGWLWIVASVVMLGSVPALSLHASALSEPVFLLLVLLGLGFLAVYLESTRRTYLKGAAVAIGLAFLARYAGAAYIATAVIAICLFDRGPLRRRAWDIGLFTAVSALPMLLWMWRNSIVGIGATGRDLIFHPIGRSQIWQAFYTASGWLLIPQTAPDLIRFLVWLLLLSGLSAVVLVRRRRKRRVGGAKPVPNMVKLLALSVVVYGAFLVVSISFVDANTPLDDRILFPVFVAGLIVSLYLLDQSWVFFTRRPALAGVIFTGVVALSAGHLASGAGVVAAGYTEGWGLNSLDWQKSRLLEQSRQLPESALLYSNVPQIVYLHTGREAHSIPRKWFAMSQQPNGNFQRELTDLGERFSVTCGFIIYIRNRTPTTALPDEHELEGQLPVSLWAEEVDGSILAADTCHP